MTWEPEMTNDKQMESFYVRLPWPSTSDVFLITFPPFCSASPTHHSLFSFLDGYIYILPIFSLILTVFGCVHRPNSDSDSR